MNIINLHPDFGISDIPFKKFIFPGGEPHIQLDFSKILGVSFLIQTKVKSAEDLILLGLVKNSLDNHFPNNVTSLYMPYVPGARQDRICEQGEPLTIQFIANYINNLNFSKVEVFDPHSSVTTNLLQKCVVKSNHEFVIQIIRELRATYNFKQFNLISPDAGSRIKTQKLVEYLTGLGIADINVIRMEKTRNKPGTIPEFIVIDTFNPSLPSIVIDDICDGGATFLGIAKTLSIIQELYLIVSHGIFSKGFKHLLTFYSEIHTTSSWIDLNIPAEENVFVHKISRYGF